MNYQNIFTQRAGAGAPDYGDGADRRRILGGDRTKRASFSWLLGWFGDAQIGPIYLGWAGTDP
jgi:photosynthetic reaction center M subunit